MPTKRIVDKGSYYATEDVDPYVPGGRAIAIKEWEAAQPHLENLRAINMQAAIDQMKPNKIMELRKELKPPANSSPTSAYPPIDPEAFLYGPGVPPHDEPDQ